MRPNGSGQPSGTLANHLIGGRTGAAPSHVFVGPDQAALMEMLAQVTGDPSRAEGEGIATR